MKVVKISKDSNMNEVNIKSSKNIIKSLLKVSLSQGNGNMTLLYTWPYKNSTIVCYGWNNGEAGFENKHDLPPYGQNSYIEKDSSEELLFGDIFIINKENDNKYIDLSISEYCEFYNHAYGGFESCESESSSNEEENEELEEDKDSDYEDDDYEETDDSFIDDCDLEEDLNNY